MHSFHPILSVSVLLLAIGTGAANAADSQSESIGITRSANGKGIPNGSSSDEDYLPWLTPSTDAGYGYSEGSPVEVGGFLEGRGSDWSAQYFASLLGPHGEPTQFERVKACCPFPTKDPKLTEAGFKKGFLDVYQVTIQGQKPVLVYVTLYSEGAIFAPKGFATRGKKP